MCVLFARAFKEGLISGIRISPSFITCGLGAVLVESLIGLEVIMDLERVKHIRKIALKAIVSDDDLMQKLVLKGGNALDIIYETASARASMDLDFSMEDDFKSSEIVNIEARVGKDLSDMFETEGYVVFDVRFMKRPSRIDPKVAEFWGGYRIEFKIIDRDEYEKDKSNAEELRRHATVVGDRQRKTFQVDISKFEYCAPKEAADIDGYTIYVYTPQMIVFEKLRAICQQMPEYLTIVKTRSSPRARDFFDIYHLIEGFRIELTLPDSIEVLRKMFAVKKVPMGLLAKIQDHREFHRENFKAVMDTVHPKITVESFDFYFDYVVETSRSILEALGEV